MSASLSVGSVLIWANVLCGRTPIVSSRPADKVFVRGYAADVTGSI
jgi:hypothetical protein